MRSTFNVWQITSAALVFIAMLLQWYGHSNALIVTPDSCNYLSAAASFKASGQFLSSDGTPYAYWPPLFPIVLSVLGDAWYWIQLLLTGAIGFLFIYLTRKKIDDPLLQLLCLVSVLLGIHLLLIGVFLWSELLFLLILLLFTIALEKDQFVAAIILGFLLCLQRNAGLFFVIGAALWMWDLRRSVILFVLSSSGLIAWNIYASVAGDNSYFTSITHNFLLMANGMMHALLPVHGLFLVGLAGVLFFVSKDDVRTRLLSIMILTYFVGLICLFKFIPSDDDRYAAVVVPFFMILFFRAVEIWRTKQTSAVRKVLLVVLICWLIYPLSRTVKNAIQWHNVSFTSYFCAFISET